MTIVKLPLKFMPTFDELRKCMASSLLLNFFYNLAYIIINIEILLILNRFTDNFLGFFNFDESYDTNLTEQEQRYLSFDVQFSS